jgi:hypothetical protein
MSARQSVHALIVTHPANLDLTATGHRVVRFGATGPVASWTADKIHWVYEW